MRTVISVLCFLLIAATSSAQDPPAVGPVNPFGLGWGSGVGFSANLDSDIVPEDGGFIDSEGLFHVTKTENVRPRILLESHYTWKLFKSVAVGPAMVVQPGGDLFEAAGGGVLIELGEDKVSFNIIIGVIMDLSVKRLALGFKDGEPAPFSEKIVVEKEEVSLLLATVFGF